MADRIYFCICDAGCKFETMTKEQILAAIAEATGNTVTNVDDAFITKIKEQNKGGTVTIWRGTTAEYNALEERDEENCIYIKTDDTTLADIGTMYNQAIAEMKRVDEKYSAIEAAALTAGVAVNIAGGIVLWSGEEQMGDMSLISLTRSISDMTSGICLIFSPYEGGKAQGNNYHHFFVPKAFVAANNNKGSTFSMHRYNFGSIGTKYLYIEDTSISGIAHNTAAATSAATGITYDNSKWVLRYVIGC